MSIMIHCHHCDYKLMLSPSHLINYNQKEKLFLQTFPSCLLSTTIILKVRKKEYIFSHHQISDSTDFRMPITF